MTVLYRKYRPQTFADVVGQPHVTRTIGAAITAGRVAHAYLFSGPRGVGKTTTARLLAKAVNCMSNNRRGEPCNRCELCVEITEGRCLDIIEIDAASHTGVEHVRENIIDAVRIAPARASKKVFIIDEVHMLSTASFNALLKTLEEPPGHALFILATTELHKVPETIRSRCQHFAFRRIARSDLERRLSDLASAEGVEVELAVITAIAQAADGSVRDAESMLGQLFAFGGKQIAPADAAFVLPHSSIERAAALIEAIGCRDTVAAVAEVRVAEAEGFDVEAYVRDAITVLRDAITADIGIADRIADRVVALRTFAALAETIGRSDHPFFALEVAVLGLVVESSPSGSRPPTQEALTHKEGKREGTGDRAATARGARHATATPIAAAAPRRRQSEKTVPMAADATLARIRAAWGSLPIELADMNGSLPYLLEGGRPQQVAEGTLTIGFRYKLHAEKVRQPNVADAIARAVSEIAGMPFRIVTAVVTAEEFARLDAAVRPKTGDAVVDAALEVFGGRVVE